MIYEFEIGDEKRVKHKNCDKHAIQSNKLDVQQSFILELNEPVSKTIPHFNVSSLYHFIFHKKRSEFDIKHLWFPIRLYVYRFCVVL